MKKKVFIRVTFIPTQDNFKRIDYYDVEIPYIYVWASTLKRVSFLFLNFKFRKG